MEIVTAERVVSSEEVRGLVVPGVDGEITVLPNHAPLLTSLKAGAIKSIKNGNEDHYIAISGGFIEVIGNKVTILADTAEREEEINHERAEAALEQAQENMASSAGSKDLEKSLAAMRRSQARLQVARRRRRGAETNVGGAAQSI